MIDMRAKQIVNNLTPLDIGITPYLFVIGFFALLTGGFVLARLLTREKAWLESL
tara:strand:+ start:3939 stop:4100 length:162 start_codon:yes stop_codon:yes gene_type:complete